MKHVNAIRKHLEEGSVEEAESALDNLLSLGPNNTEALKLQAQIKRFRGDFAAEMDVYKSVLKIDRQDQDAIRFFLDQQQEDREHFYFTEECPGSGRRYHLYPRQLVHASLIGLLGCVAFLSLGKLLSSIEGAQNEILVLGIFLLLVITPWVAILYHLVKGVKHVDINKEGIEIATRIKSFKLMWHQVHRITVIFPDALSPEQMEMTIESQTRHHPTIKIDLSAQRSSLRAKTYFINDFIKQGQNVYFSSAYDLPSDGSQLIKI